MTTPFATKAQLRPSCDVHAKIDPCDQLSRSQTGKVDVRPATKATTSPDVDRVMNSISPPGRTSRIAIAAPTSRPALTITPDFAKGSVF